MIAPRNRLLILVALVALPCSLLGAVEPAAAYAALALTAAFVAATVIDAIRAPRVLRGLEVELPPVTRMSRDREGRIEVRVRNAPQTARRVTLALAFPREIEADREEERVSLPGGNEWSRLNWTCRPRRRGLYRLEHAFLEAESPLGLWAARKTVPAPAEIRVYPNLAQDRKQLAPLFLNRGSFGVHTQRQVGKGREFEKLRDYSPGDSYDEVHWKATARRGRPITKVFQIERTQEVYVVLDASRLSARPAPESGDGTPGAPALERFISAALVLGLAAEHQGDLFGLITFSDRVGAFLRARNGKAHYSACRDALYLLESRTVSPDYDEIFTFIRLRLRRRALLVVLTALDDPALAESFVRSVDLVRRQHLVLVNMIQPAGVSPVFSHPGVESVDDVYRHLGGHLLWRKLRELESVLQRRGVRFSLLKNERLSAELVSQYLSVKQRQAL